jgi:HTH-type transcriptional regulator / antitoxin HipB
MRQLITAPNQVAEVFRGRRKVRGLSQHALAEKLGTSQSRLSSLEEHPERLTLERLLALANLLDLELVLQDKSNARNPPAEW